MGCEEWGVSGVWGVRGVGWGVGGGGCVGCGCVGVLLVRMPGSLEFVTWKERSRDE